MDVFRAHDVGYFCYIGGNDSMDTANKVAQLAAQRGLDLVAVGVPKTIDNDVGDSQFKLIDHTPGYGSTARYWAHAVQFANEENAGSSPADPVLVLQAMGRKIGFIPAAARLADPGRELPLQIYLAERPVTLEQIADNVNGLLRRAGRAILVVSEGLSIGDLGARKDAFGHTQFSASELTVAQVAHQRAEREGPAGQRVGPRECAGNRPATQHDLRLDRRSRRGLSRWPKGGRAGGNTDGRFHGHHPAGAGADL